MRGACRLPRARGGGRLFVLLAFTIYALFTNVLSLSPVCVRCESRTLNITDNRAIMLYTFIPVGLNYIPVNKIEISLRFCALSRAG